MVEARSSKRKPKLGNKENQNPRKFYYRFLFKALILTVLCAIVPVFLSQTPELANQTRLLELLHLIFVGIAVSYGLFSSRNYDGGGGGGGSSNSDHNKADHHNNSHSYVPKILEVSSVFNVDHESESEPSDDSSGDHRKFQTWRNKYNMKIPETRFVDRVNPGIREKPLLLPVRSLNYSRVSDYSGDNSGRWEKVRSKRQLLKTLGEDNSDVLPSPIPWRSRSSSSTTEIESQPLIKNLTQSSSFSSPRKSTPLPNLTSEFHPSPPPPPPPPPLPAFYNSATRKDYPRIYRTEPRESSAYKKNYAGGEFHPPPPPPPPPPAEYYKSPPTKLRVSSERRKSSEQKMKFDDRSAKRSNCSKKVWWSDPVEESKEQDNEKNDQRSFLGSKAMEESEDEEHRRRENEIQHDEEKKVEEEEGVCESNNGSDVDKKADEFIAKFREQIRLQRIESIKRSANKISASSSR
ncbi:hypothetical protein V5N11_031459 [Cardamine amara subsp. amara]|uniref:Hydroxyproline-rich glycoprotein family protein n=1 Tax=Cardamine amara subsp. amara TaxID=228776 RepID=A0ABD0ZIZ9_CARAN